MNITAETVATDKVVQFTYFITNALGEMVERVDLPLTTVIGRHNRLYDSVERALMGKQAGDEITIDVPATEGAWGEPDPNLIIVEDLDNVPPPYRRIGQEAQFQNEQGEMKTFRVTNVDATHVTLDANHPFAGQTMQFHVTILSIRQATDAELISGIDAGVPPATLH